MLLILEPSLSEQLKILYQDMEQAYNLVAQPLGHGCEGCPDNCCDSYFVHHTYIEWAYLLQGLDSLADDRRRALLARAEDYELEAQKIIAEGGRPKIMCPVNEDGRCMLYPYRLMVCRTHGVPASMTRPDGKRLVFPGCFRCQDLIVEKAIAEADVPLMERTLLLRRLVMLEQQFLQGKRHIAPKVKRTIASMLVSGPPDLPHCSDVKNGWNATGSKS